MDDTYQLVVLSTETNLYSSRVDFDPVRGKSQAPGTSQRLSLSYVQPVFLFLKKKLIGHVNTKKNKILKNDDRNETAI